ncbi:hypothetical protein NADFUDRAFT_50730 [Nadsonia fulvescens var. elongata DSM 6958]|uniref:UBR-type domain-containing protein n=1 Tax=Nadsonia fulvescens var. elongata DSM 6958 TaxID=857566 RepID=A0A1E3PN08_9ASCO|nr:hypothetical protein NADFUDRAFT_50730 [Nadsonia fulvescens var. elongata DSM 6958]
MISETKTVITDKTNTEPDVSGSVTALDYIEEQTLLEREAAEAMPYDPNRCTYVDGPLRQQVYACLTCQEKSFENHNKLKKKKSAFLSGICYSCSIQCHSSHELVELFVKRDFVCDCGTTRMPANGGCNIRQNFDSLDPHESDNKYDHNFAGRFCHCDRVYEVENEFGTMYQCALGDVCGEDWYHEECILGLPVGSVDRSQKCDIKNELEPTANVYEQGVNMYDKLDSAACESVKAPDEILEEQGKATQENDEGDDSEDEDETIEGLPKPSEFDIFVCWKCVDKNQAVLGPLSGRPNIALPGVVHRESNNFEERQQWLRDEGLWQDTDLSLKRPHDADVTLERHHKKSRLDNLETIHEDRYDDGVFNDGKAYKMKQSSLQDYSFSLFLVPGFNQRLAGLRAHNTELDRFLSKNEFFVTPDVIYQPPEDTDTNSSLLDAGASALEAMPREQGLDSIRAYDLLRERLHGFLKPFADEGKIVTEADIKGFWEDK